MTPYSFADLLAGVQLILEISTVKTIFILGAVLMVVGSVVSWLRGPTPGV